MLVETLITTKHEDPVPIIPKALDEMYREHHTMVFRTAYRVTGNVADAEDVLQTVFLQDGPQGRFGGRHRASRKLPAPGRRSCGARSGPRQAFERGSRFRAAACHGRFPSGRGRPSGTPPAGVVRTSGALGGNLYPAILRRVDQSGNRRGSGNIFHHRGGDATSSSSEYCKRSWEQLRTPS